jgi:hypothetical protein
MYISERRGGGVGKGICTKWYEVFQELNDHKFLTITHLLTLVSRNSRENIYTPKPTQINKPAR